MKWQRILFTIVLNIFLMMAVTILMEYSHLTERFVSIEDTVQEALDQAISASIHSEEFFSEQYQGTLMSYAGVENGSNDASTAASTLVWLRNSRKFVLFNTYQLADWYWRNGEKLPSNSLDASDVSSTGIGHRYGLTGYVFEWLYGSAGSDYRNPGLAYANKNSAKLKEYQSEATGRGVTNANFQAYYTSVGRLQQTTGYLKDAQGSDSYKLALHTYPTLANMGLTLDSLNSTSSSTTADNLCSSLHVGKSRLGSNKTYYFLTPSSLGVTYIPYEVLKPVFIANLDLITRFNKLGGTSKASSSTSARDTLDSASHCVTTSVYDFNTNNDRYTSGETAGSGYAAHLRSNTDELIVTDGLIEFDLSTVQVKVDYFYHDFGDGSAASALLMSKLNGTLTPDGAGYTTESQLRQATLNAFLNQDSGKYVSPFLSSTYYNDYQSVGKARVVARVTAKVKVHVPYQSGLLQWACYMFTGTNHFDIKRFNPSTQSAFTSLGDSDGLWYQYTTYVCTSRS